jgi:hypothetical protein
VAVDNPTGFDGTILKKIKDIEQRLDELSATTLGKVKFMSAQNAPGISPVLTSSTVTATITVDVPPLATSCGYSAFAQGSGLNTTSGTDYLTVQVDLYFGAYHRWTQLSQSTPTSTEATVVVPQVDSFTFPAGGGTLTLTATANVGVGPWTNTAYNTLFAEGLLIFQY